MSIDLKEMLKAGVHFGHKTSRWSPKMRPFIWGAKNKVHLIDVSKSAFLLERAGNFLKDVSSTGGSVLFIGTKKAAQDIVARVAKSLNMPYVINRWVGGTLSNYDQVKKAITRYLHLKDVVQKSTTHYKKKEIVMINKEIARLDKNIGGIINLDYPPAAIVIVDAKKEHSAVKEASRLGLPIIAMVDTNTDPEGVSFVIPSNDDSPKAIAFILEYLEGSVKAGRAAFTEQKAKERSEAEAKRAAEKNARTEKTEKPEKTEKIEKIEVKEAKAPVKPVKKEAPEAHKEAKETKEAKAPAKAVKPEVKTAKEEAKEPAKSGK